MEHYNVSFNDNGTLTTIPIHPLVWVPEMSVGTEDDILVLPNIALLVSINCVIPSALLLLRWSETMSLEMRLLTGPSSSLQMVHKCIMGAPRKAARSDWAGRESEDAHEPCASGKHY
jgi:hypothetical protein